MTDASDQLKCRVHGIPCEETTDCGCEECTEHNTLAYLEERNAKLNAKMVMLQRRYRNLPSSSVFYMDKRILYIWTAEYMLYSLCQKLGLPPAFVRLRPDPRLLIPPDVDVQAPEAWVKATVAKDAKGDEGDLRSMVDSYVRGIVRVVADEFQVEWEKRQVDFGYTGRKSLGAEAEKSDA